MNPKSSWHFEAEAREYSASLTGNPLLFRESRVLLQMLDEGKDPATVAREIEEGNLFQHRSAKSIPKRTNALLARFSGVPREVTHFIATAPVPEARLVLILVLAVRDRLFREFLQELVFPLLRSHDATLTKSAAERFLDGKATLSPRVAGWKPEARTKLRTVFTRALIESGLLAVRGREHVAQVPMLAAETEQLVRECFPPSYWLLLEGRP